MQGQGGEEGWCWRRQWQEEWDWWWHAEGQWGAQYVARDRWWHSLVAGAGECHTVQWGGGWQEGDPKEEWRWWKWQGSKCKLHQEEGVFVRDALLLQQGHKLILHVARSPSFSCFFP